MESIVIGTVRARDRKLSVHDYTVEIDEYLTGSGPDTITTRDASACSGFSYANPVGKAHLLFLSRDEAGRLRTSMCVGSGAIDADHNYMESTIEQIRLLAAGGPAPATEALPTSVADELPQAGSGGDLPEQGNAWLFLAIAGAGLGVTGLGVLLRHGTHRR